MLLNKNIFYSLQNSNISYKKQEEWRLIIMNCESEKFPFMDYELPIEKRVEDIVSRMTIEEKISQMLHSSPLIERLGIPAYNWWNE